MAKSEMEDETTHARAKHDVVHYIREWRTHRGLTVDGLGEAAGISGSMVSQLERGRTTYTQTTLQKIAEALNVQPWKLLAAGPDEDQRLWTVVLQSSLPEIGLDLDEAGKNVVSMLISNNYRAAIRSACSIFGKGIVPDFDADEFTFKWEAGPGG
jgi:transcriptional regulator with XRE-family HTH domain